jgi:hypothetical protein
MKGALLSMFLVLTVGGCASRQRHLEVRLLGPEDPNTECEALGVASGKDGQLEGSSDHWEMRPRGVSGYAFVRTPLGLEGTVARATRKLLKAASDRGGNAVRLSGKQEEIYLHGPGYVVEIFGDVYRCPATERPREQPERPDPSAGKAAAVDQGLPYRGNAARSE